MLNKQAGTIYESEFKTNALKKGLDVFPSEGDYSIVDCVVLNPAGKAFRVQIKGTQCCLFSDGVGRKPSANKFKIVVCKSKTKSGMSAKEVDVLACYIQPRNTWYIIPMIKAVDRKTLAFYLVDDSKSQWEPYRDNWDVFFN